jgi:hypothetical protein
MKQLIVRMSNNIPASGRSYFPELGWDISMNTVKQELEEDVDINDYMNNYFLVREVLDDSYTEISESNSDFLKRCISLDSGQKFDDLSQINIIEQTVLIFPNDPNDETIQQDTTNYNIPDDNDYQGSTFS